MKEDHVRARVAHILIKGLIGVGRVTQEYGCTTVVSNSLRCPVAAEYLSMLPRLLKNVIIALLALYCYYHSACGGCVTATVVSTAVGTLFCRWQGDTRTGRCGCVGVISTAQPKVEFAGEHRCNMMRSCTLAQPEHQGYNERNCAQVPKSCKRL